MQDDANEAVQRLTRRLRSLLWIPFVMESVPFLLPGFIQRWLPNLTTFLAYQLLCLVITSGILMVLVHPALIMRLRPAHLSGRIQRGRRARGNWR